MFVCVCLCVCLFFCVVLVGGGGGPRCRLYAIASALVLNVDSWISLTYSGAIERKQVAEYVGGEGGREGEKGGGLL